MRLEHGTKHHITKIEEFTMQYKLLTEIDPKTISLQNMGYRVNQGKTRLKNTPETINPDMINVNPRRILWYHPSSFFFILYSWFLITYSLLLLSSYLLLIPSSLFRMTKIEKIIIINICSWKRTHVTRTIRVNSYNESIQHGYQICHIIVSYTQ